MAAPRATAAGFENTLALQAPPLSSRLGNVNEIKCEQELVVDCFRLPDLFLSNCCSHLRLPAPEWGCHIDFIPLSSRGTALSIILRS